MQQPPEPKALGRHNRWVWDVAFSGDSETLASISQDETVIVWDVQQALSQTLSFGLTGTSLAFGGKGRSRWLVAGGAGGNLALYDMNPWLTGRDEPVRVERHSRGTSTAWGLDVSPKDENLLVTGIDSSSGFAVVKLWRLPNPDVETNRTLSPLTLGFHGHSRGIFDVEFTSDGTRIVGGGQDGLLSLWQVREGEHIRRFPSSIADLALSEQSDSENLRAILSDGQLVMETIASRQRITRELGLENSRVAFDSRGETVAGVTAEGLLWLRDIAEQTTLTQSITLSGTVESIIVETITDSGASAAAKFVAVGDSSGRVHLWTPTTAPSIDSLRVLTAPTVGKITTLAFAPLKRILAIGACRQILVAGDPSNCTAGHLQLWNIDTLQQIGDGLPGRSGYISALAFSPDERWLAAGTEDNVISVWEISEGQERFYHPSVASGGVRALAFSPNGKLLASGSGSSRVYLWQVPTGQPYGDSYPDHDSSIIGFAFSADGTRLFSASTDQTVVIHDLDMQRLKSQACRVVGRWFTHDESIRYLGSFAALRTQVTGWKSCPDTPQP